MLCIRISEQEYEGLKSVCDARGARSISDLAREAVSRLLDHQPAESNTPDWVRRVEEIDSKVEGLILGLQRLERIVSTPPDSPDFTSNDLRSLEAVNGT